MRGRSLAPGDKYGSWTLLRLASKSGTMYRWQCRCACGTEREVTSTTLVSGQSRSCGCHRHARGSVQGNAAPTRSANFGKLVASLTEPRGARMALARTLGQSPNRIYGLCDGKQVAPTAHTVKLIADALQVDAHTRRALHIAAALDAGYEIGDPPAELVPGWKAGI